MIPQLVFALLFALLEEEAAQRKQLFHNLAMASHELKTPLTTIKGALQLAQRQLHPPPGRGEAASGKIDGLLASALRQVDHLTLLVGDLNTLVERRARHPATNGSVLGARAHHDPASTGW